MRTERGGFGSDIVFEWWMIVALSNNQMNGQQLLTFSVGLAMCSFVKRKILKLDAHPKLIISEMRDSAQS